MSCDIQALLDAGTHWYCTTCKWVRTANRTACPDCGSHQPGHQPQTTRKKRRTPKNAVRAGDGLGSLATLPNNTLWIVVTGTPIGQGSVRAVAPGVVAHEPELHAWRDHITQTCLRVVGSTWQPPTCPLVLDITITCPLPDNYPRDEAYIPNQPYDSDKLLRAIGDALSPRTKKNERRFKLVHDDGRFNDDRLLRTHPRPLHTHSWALPTPGAVLRIAPDGLDVPPMPRSTHTPGDLPDQALRRYREL